MKLHNKNKPSIIGDIACVEPILQRNKKFHAKTANINRKDRKIQNKSHFLKGLTFAFFCVFLSELCEKLSQISYIRSINIYCAICLTHSTIIKTSLFLILVLGQFAGVDAQKFEQFSVPVTNKAGKKYLYPFAGGINNLQLSEIDLNNDGIKDLFVFDRAGDFITCFLNGGTAGKVDYQYAPEYAALFPVLKDYVLLRDYDGDGLEDIFACASNTQGAAGMEVYHASRENGKLKFTLRKQEGKDFDILYYRVGVKLFNIQIDAPDYPAVDDVDGDGDLDILTFEPLGGYVYFFRNMVVEKGKSLEKFDFELEDRCWGKFYESGVDEEISLSKNPDKCFEQIKGPVETRHSGSTMLLFDNDGDGDKEVLIGDLTSLKLNLLTNGGSKENAFMNQQDAQFPSYDQPVEMSIFLTSFFIDLNNDQKRDLVAGVNVPRASANYNSAWYYPNKGTDDKPFFEFKQDNVLVDEMIDFGTGVRPVFVDYNADGLLDIIAGNDHYYEEGGKKNARLFVLENVGTKTQPAYKIVDEDYLGMSKFSVGLNGTWSYAPCFGDLDNDGDLDLLVGELNGRLFHAENIAGPNAPFKFGPVTYNYHELNAQRVSVPAIQDIDGDGLNDIVLGTRQATNDEDRKACGNFYFFKNIGTKTEANFDPDPFAGDNTRCFGQVILQDVHLKGGRVYSSPYFYNHDGEVRMYVGSNSGIKVLGNVLANIDGQFDRLEEHLGDIVDGEHVHVALEDINDDDILDMLVGTYRGGMNLYKTNIKVNGELVSNNSVYNSSDIIVSPNPTSEFLNINSHIDGAQYYLYEMNGVQILKGQLKKGIHTVGLEKLNNGIYILKVTNSVGKIQLIKKIVKTL